MRYHQAGYKDFRKEHPKKEAADFLADQPYKLELITDIVDEQFRYILREIFRSLQRTSSSLDGMVKYAKILFVSGAYWSGDEKNKMLQRIYATSFVKKTSSCYVTMIAEAKKRPQKAAPAWIVL